MGRLQNAVQQLKSKNQPILDNADRSLGLLSLNEAKATASTLFEGVIADCANASTNKTTFQKEILKQPYVSQFLPLADKMSGTAGKNAFATKGKTEKQKIETLWKFSEVCKKTLNNKRVDAGAGQSKKKVSEPWIEMSKKKGGVDTSKADIMVGSDQTSVKGPSALLMSGEKKESRATVISALQTTKVNDEVRKALISQVDKFVESTRTIGADVNATNLKKMSADDAKKSGNKDAKEIVDKQQQTKKEIIATFNKAFKSKIVADAFCREAMTGYEKFGGKAFPDRSGGDKNGEATHMLIWDYRMDRMRFTKIDSKLISETASKMKMDTTLKSASYEVGGDKAGYSFWQTLKFATKTYLDAQGNIVTEAAEEIQQNRQMLSEGMINEIKFKDTLKKIYTKAKEKLVGIFKYLVDKIKQIVKVAKEILKGGIDKILNYFELDVDVKVNPRVNFTV
jgi:hypothetical protein